MRGSTFSTEHLASNGGNLMKKMLLLVLTLVIALPSLPARAKESNHFLTPGEMVKAMDKSKTSYKIDMLKSLKDMGPEQFAEVYWPSSEKQLEYPWISDDGKGGLSLLSYPFEGGSMDIVKEAESAYGDKKYDRAAELYQKAIEASPKCYFAYIGLGDCRFFSGDFDKALESYQKATDLNPFDFRGFFFKAHALVKMKRFKEAKEAFIESLTLHPRRKSIITTVKNYATQMGVVIEDASFLPQSLARLEGDTVAIYSNPEDLPWFYHAMCKGFWLGDPGHRKELTGHEEHRWSTSEESECLAALVIGYEQSREDGKIPQNATIERIKTILDDGMLNEFVYYQIYARLSPDVTLLLPAAERSKLKDYVAKYVLVPSNESDAGKRDAKTGP